LKLCEKILHRFLETRCNIPHSTLVVTPNRCRKERKQKKIKIGLVLHLLHWL